MPSASSKKNQTNPNNIQKQSYKTTPSGSKLPNKKDSND